MKTIEIKQFCKSYNIQSSFMDSLQEFELVRVIQIENRKHIPIDDISRVEKLLRLHYDLNLNFEALDIIDHLTNQVYELQNEVLQLKNELDFYR